MWQLVEPHPARRRFCQAANSRNERHLIVNRVARADHRLVNDAFVLNAAITARAAWWLSPAPSTLFGGVRIPATPMTWSVVKSQLCDQQRTIQHFVYYSVLIVDAP